MKKLFYILAGVLLLSSCSDSFFEQKEEGDEVTLKFSINTPEDQVIETRALGEMSDDIQKSLNLWLMVFDENGIFVQAAKAEVGDNFQHDGHTDTRFTVTLNKTSATRVIHFIAYDGDENDGVGALIGNLANQFGTEASMVAQQLFTTGGQAAYWQRQTVVGITEETTFSCVPLVRNFSKVTISKKDGLNFTIDGYAIVNNPSRGAVAPYYGAEFIDYINGRANKTYEQLSDYPGTVPTGTTYSVPAEADLQTSGSLYLYETPNAAGDDKGRTSLVIKGRAGNAATSTYYKVDLIYNDADHEEYGNLYYNFLRNFEFKVTIDEVIGPGYTTLAGAVNGAASNNLSASTATSSLSHISDGIQMIEVTNIYYCYTEGGLKQQLKYRFLYNTGGNNWVTNNDLVNVTTDNNDIFTDAGWSVATTDDADGWRTITMNLKQPTAQTLSSIFHIYASLNKIQNSNLSADLKTNLTSGEQLYRDVRVDLRHQYQLIVDCPSYVPGVEGTGVRVNLLIPQDINEALFPMDFYIEDLYKHIYPDASSSVKLPVHVGETVVATQSGSSFQYTRTITKQEYKDLVASTNPEDKKTVNGVNYVVVPCYFKTNVAASATTIYAGNDYFTCTPDNFLNVAVAFTDDTELTIASDWTEYFGRKYPVTLTFSVTQEAVAANTPFTINVTENGTTYPYTVRPTSAGTYTYTYYTQSMNGSSISATVTAQITGRDPEVLSATLPMNRRYFVIKAYSFNTNITDFLDTGQTGDGSQIYVDGTYVGWFGRGLSNASDGYLTNTGPKLDYIIDRSYQNYATLTDDMVVSFEVYNPNKHITAETTIKDLDDARNGDLTTLTVTFVDHTQ